MQGEKLDYSKDGQHCRTKHLLRRTELLTPSIMHFRP